MGLESYITDAKTHKKAHVADCDSTQGLVVVTHPLKTYTNQNRFFSNPTYGINMNLEVSVGGSPEIVYQENIEWTTSAISGTWDFASSTIAPYAGGKSIEAINTINNDTAQLAKGSNFALTNSISITGRIHLTSWDNRGTKGINIYGWDTGTGTIVGNSVDLEDYINIGTIGSWQQFSISLSDMALTGEIIDAIRIQTINIVPGLAPDYYLDNIQIEQISEGIGITQFTVEPDLNTWLHVINLNIMLADNDYDSTIADADAKRPTLPSIPYDSILGVAALSSGISYQREQDGIVEFSYSIKQLSDFLILPGTEIVSQGSDKATNTWLLMRTTPPEPIILKPENNDKLSITISENLSGLDVFRVSAGCKEEDRT